MKWIKRTGLFFLMLLSGWLVYAQVGMKFRMSDKKAKQKFSDAGITLITPEIDINGFKLHYAQTGSDTMPTLFFVHGSPGSWMKFGNYLRDADLLKKYRMVSVDRPGFGYSGFGQAKTLQQQSDIITELLKKLQNGKPIYAIGRSYGGPVIAKLAVDNPGYFSGLVFCAGSLDPAAEKKEKWRSLFVSFPLKFFIPGAWRPSNKELWWLKKELLPLSEKLSSITCPVHIFHGDKDNLVPVSNALWTKQKLVNAPTVTVTVIPGGGHHVSDDYYDLIKETLQKLY
jgi:pimeloyl-ACP methyl ester carboxylesterase